MDTSVNDTKFTLSHGQVLWTIEAMHIVEWLDKPGLDSVLKKFRREKVPDFSQSGQKGRQGADFAYRFEHLMDCVVAMKLTAEGLAFRHVVGLMRFDPEKLWQLYRKTYLEAKIGKGTALEIQTTDGRKKYLCGLYLDFHAHISKNGDLSTPGPRLLDPWAALDRYMGFYSGFYPVGMVRLSDLAIEAVRLAKEAPVARRGQRR